MDKANALNRARISSKFLNQLSILTNGNLSKSLQAITEIYGVVSQKQTNGVFDDSLKVEQNTPTSLAINIGHAISNNDGVVRVIAITSKDVVDVSALLNNVVYNLYLVPKATSYENGTISLTNGSKIVTISEGDFSKVDPFESIIVDTSVLGNDAVYEVYNIVSANTVQLVNTFTGTSESNLKWQIVGNFKGYKIASKDDLIYSYDGYDIIISSESLSTGFVLANFRKAGGVIEYVTDRRSENLFTTKAIGKVLADAVVTGVINAITTIEEKASAASIDKIITDNIYEGYKMGLGTSIDGDILTISAGTVYTSTGKRVELPANTNINLSLAVSNGEIIEGDNSLYINYSSPNTYSFTWNNTKRGSVIIGKISYHPETLPEAFTVVEEVKNPIKHIVNSVVFEKKNIGNYMESELYYREGILYYQYLDTSVRPSPLKEVEVINLNRFNELLDSVLRSVTKSERVRFNLFPTAEKDSWFFNNGIQSPILIGYNHKILSWKVGILPMATPAETSQVYDYTTKEVLVTSKISNIISRDVNRNGNADTTLGVHFYGSGSINMVRLVHEGNVIDETNMNPPGDTLGQAAINQLYQVEVVIESSDIIVNTSQTIE